MLVEWDAVNTKCVSYNGQTRVLPLKNDMTGLQALTCPKEDVSRDHCNVDDYVQEKHARSYIYDLA